MGRAFPTRSGCPVPSMSAIDGVLVSSCLVDPPPEPIFQFPIFDKPLANPPSFDFGCYAPSLITRTFVNQVTPFANGTVTFPKTTETGQCQPLFTFNVGFPAANCPDISTSASITILPPDSAPSVSLKVTKSSDCSFSFNLSIGIPGGTCVKVSEVDVFGPDFTLNDGDNFTVPTDIVLTSTMSGGCKLYTLIVEYTMFTLDIGPGPITTTPHRMTPDPGCCVSFSVVRSVNGGADGLLDWYYSVITIPTTTLVYDPDLPTLTIGCDTLTPVIRDLAMSSTEDCPCGTTLVANIANLTFDLPNTAPPAVTDNTASPEPCCSTIEYIDGTGSTPITLVSDACAYHLVYTRKAFILPQTSVVTTVVYNTNYDITLSDPGTNVVFVAGITSTPISSCGCGIQIQLAGGYITTGGVTENITYVCTLSCVGSSLVYTTGVLYFSNGIYIGHTGCS